VIHTYLSTLANDGLRSELFEPHIQPEDFFARSAQAALSDIAPQFSFWQVLDYVGIPTETGPVSCNMYDVLYDATHEVPFELRSSRHFRDALWTQLYVEYLGVRVVEDQVFKHLNRSTITMED
jgi:hypothetical protein